MTATYAYDVDGLRASKTVNGGTTQKFTWGAGGANPLLLEQTTGTAVTSIIYGPGGQPVAQVEPDGTTRRYHRDQLGSVRLTTSATNGGLYPRVGKLRHHDGSYVVMFAVQAGGPIARSRGRALPMMIAQLNEARRRWTSGS